MKKIRRRTGQKLRFLSVILCFLICFTACSHPKGDPLEYRSRSFSATVSVESDSMNFDAIFHIKSPNDDQSIDFEIDFIAPESLNGLSIIQDGEGFEILLGEEKYTDILSSILRELDIGKAVKLLSPEEPIISVKSADGYTVVSTRDATVYIDPDTALPVKATDAQEKTTVTVKDFCYS